MHKLIARFRKWKNWKRYNAGNAFYKLLVLIGLAHNPSFERWIDHA